MTISDFTQNHAVIHKIDALKKHWKQHKPKISDVYSGTDANRTHQYVDLVMEGGGVLGVALCGYTWALEQVGIRFLSVGGTSAGSINALLLAGLGTPDSERAEKVLEIVAALDMMEFVDGGDDAEDFVRDLGKKSLIGRMQRLRSITRNLDEVFSKLGMNSGDAFLDWLTEHLASAGVHTTADLQEQMSSGLDDLKHPRGVEPSASLRVVSTDITIQRKAVFPDDAGLYFSDANSVNPAVYVRASMAVPYFFEPLRVPIVNRSPDTVRMWRDKAEYTGRIPGEVLFVDGGVLSNFPISLFHVPSHIARPPSRPTFGIKLSPPTRDPTVVDGPVSLAAAMFGTARRSADAEFLRNHPDFKHLVGYIDTGDSNWLNFAMRREEKIRLFDAGVEAACDFLMSFTSFGWDTYKDIRAQLHNTTGHGN